MAALVVATEWLPRHGDLQVTLIQRENACILRKHGLDVFYMVLQATEEDKADAEKHGITLVTPKQIDLFVNKDPSIDWLMLHQSIYPHITGLNIGVIIGHVTADPYHTTANAAKSIQREIFKVAEFIPVFHTIPPDVISNAETAHKLEKNMLELTEGANLVVSVGPKVWKFFSNKVANRDLHMRYLPFVDESICSLHFEDRHIENNVELLSHVRESLTKCCDEYKAVAGAVGRVSTSFYDTLDLTSKWKFAAGHPVNQFEDFRSNFHKLTNNAQSLEINKIHTGSISDLSNLMQQSHIFIHGPNTDPVGITPLIACTVGIPSIITSNCGFAEFLQEHFPLLAEHVIVRVGLYQSDADTEEWRKAVVNIIKKYPHRQEAARKLKKSLIESAKNGQISECHKIFAEYCSAACDAIIQGGDVINPDGDNNARRNPMDTSVPKVSPRKRKLDGDKEGPSLTASPLRVTISDDLESPSKSQRHDEYRRQEIPSHSIAWTRQLYEVGVHTQLSEFESAVNQSNEADRLDTADYILRKLFSTVQSKDDLPAVMKYAERIDAILKDIHRGSLLVVFECMTQDAVEILQTDERSGKLREIFEKDIVTEETLKGCKATSISLKTTVETWQYQKCALEIKYYQKGAVSDSVADAERKIQQEKIDVDSSAVVPKARSEEEILGQADDIESSQGPDISEEHVYDHSIGDTSKVVKERTSQGKHLASDQTQGTALLAMEIEPKAYLGDVHRGVLSKFVGDFTQIPMETSEKSAGNALVLLKKAHRNMPTLRLEILHLLGIRKIFRNISLESCVQTDEVGRECFSPSKLVQLLGTDIEDLFMNQIGTIGKGSLLAQALTPLKTITVDKNHLCLSNYLQQEYEDCQLAKMDSNVSKHLKNQMELQMANVEQQKNKLEEKLRQWTPVWKKKNDTISELQKMVEEKNKEISHIVEALKQTTMNLRTQLSVKEEVSHAKMMQDVLVDLDELIQEYSDGKGEGLTKSDSEDLEYIKELAADTLIDANMDDSVTNQKQTELGITKHIKSGQSKMETTESAMENTQLAESTEVVTEVGYIAGLTDGKNGKAMESPLASKLTSSDPQFTGPKDTKDIFSRDTATDEAINQKDGVKSISEVSVVSRDTEDSHKISIKKKKKKTFSGRISSAFQKLVSRFTSPGKKGDINAVDEDVPLLPVLGHGAKHHSKDGNTYLHIAAGSCDIAKVNAAIKAGADLERKNKLTLVYKEPPRCTCWLRLGSSR
ncbi:uncharacterized protein [Ptychodera flava]|uniref:uncharacterized protein n=1 Tax=Ptychodera flava TaxID=63121 RepID=UPI00396A4653